MPTAIVVGSGHNGLAAALTLAADGVDVTVLEAQAESQTRDGGIPAQGRRNLVWKGAGLPRPDALRMAATSLPHPQDVDDAQRLGLVVDQQGEHALAARAEESVSDGCLAWPFRHRVPRRFQEVKEALK